MKLVVIRADGFNNFGLWFIAPSCVCLVVGDYPNPTLDPINGILIKNLISRAGLSSLQTDRSSARTDGGLVGRGAVRGSFLN